MKKGAIAPLKSFRRSLAAGRSTSGLSSALLARLLVMRVLLQLSKNAALLQLHIKFLQRTVNRFIWLYYNVDQ